MSNCSVERNWQQWICSSINSSSIAALAFIYFHLFAKRTSCCSGCLSKDIVKRLLALEYFWVILFKRSRISYQNKKFVKEKCVWRILKGVYTTFHWNIALIKMGQFLHRRTGNSSYQKGLLSFNILQYTKYHVMCTVYIPTFCIFFLSGASFGPADFKGFWTDCQMDRDKCAKFLYFTLCWHYFVLLFGLGTRVLLLISSCLKF